MFFVQHDVDGVETRVSGRQVAHVASLSDIARPTVDDADAASDEDSDAMNVFQLHESRKAKLVTFYRNGDPHFNGLSASVSPKLFATFDSLLAWLDTKIPVNFGVRHIFTLPDGREVLDISEFVSGRSYVVAGEHRVKNVVYGESGERFWKNRVASSGQVQPLKRPSYLVNGKKKSYSDPGNSRLNSMESGARGLGHSRPPESNRPRVIVLRSNTDRTSHQKVLFNPQTTQTYEEILHDITNMLNLRFPPVVALFTEKPPNRKVSLSVFLFYALSLSLFVSLDFYISER